MRHIKLGVVGNMSPAADEMFQSYIRLYSEARTDQEHPCVVVVKNPDIPDRTAYIMGKAPDPTDEVAASIDLLETAGASFVAMPCNTVHYCFDAIQKRTQSYVMHMVKETAAHVAATHKSDAPIGLLATAGTVKTRLYHDIFDDKGMALVTPDAEMQMQNVHAAIYGQDGRGGLKAGEFSRNVDSLCAAVEHLRGAGADAVILGCTELPLALGELQPRFPHVTFIDPMAITAKKCIEIYRLAEKYIGEDLPGIAEFSLPISEDDAPSVARYVAALTRSRLSLKGEGR